MKSLVAMVFGVLAAGAVAAGCGGKGLTANPDGAGAGGGGGSGDPACANVGCAATPLCSVGCEAHCGCCPCADGMTVPGPNGEALRCAGGCWLPLTTGGDAGATTDVLGAADRPPPGPTISGSGPYPPSGAVDIVFLVDDSQSMSPLQQRMIQAFPAFVDALKALPGGQPSLHVAVISSSLGAGLYSDVPGCGPGAPGNLDGAFQHDPTCAALHADQRFIVSDRGAENFDGDISAVFGCIATLGDRGCGFEHQFAATRLALERARTPGDPDNAGFLRDDAALAIVMLTNEDDCSAPPDSTLFDPTQFALADPLGGLFSYRCNEFGHLCAGAPPPHMVADGTTVTLTGCTSAEAQGRLTTVADFVSFLKAFKGDPTRVFVAALAGPPTPYVVGTHTAYLPANKTEIQPVIEHSCMAAADSSYADPGVRLKMWIDAFGANGVFEDVCADDLTGPMSHIGMALGAAIHP